MSLTGTPSVMHTTNSMPAAAASRMPSAAGRGHVDHARGGAGFHRIAHGIENRQAQVALTATARGHATDRVPWRALSV
jgi:hypothetical protein